MVEKAKGKNVQKKTNKESKDRKKIVGTRGRVFKGLVTKKFEKRVVVEFVLLAATFALINSIFKSFNLDSLVFLSIFIMSLDFKIAIFTFPHP